ncbi:hypothetical protein PHYC_01781 [Phycisphaerales bacterium]|nr:hypothetical protein PHYC_01781 [Phycisphaerales bacterium]
MSRIDELVKQAQDHASAGRHDQALGLLTRALQAEPRHLGVLAGLCLTHHSKGDRVRALYFARRARDAYDTPETRLNLAIQLALTHDGEGALRELEPVLDGERAFGPACFRAARILADLGRPDEAAARARGWADRWPDVPPLWQAHVEALSRLGDTRGQMAAIREGLRRFPRYRPFAEWLASTALYVDDMPEAEVHELARAHAALLPPAPPPESIPRRAPDGTIRLGLLSPDFRTHSVSYFLLPLLRGLWGGRVKVFLYDTGDEHDAMTGALRGLAASWKWCRPLKDGQIAQVIRRDGVDVLLDLAGLTRGCTPGVLATRAARVQGSFLGYAGMTFLPGCDVRIADATTDPPGSEVAGAERLERLDPCFLCYQPGELPAARATARRAGVSFGSFNALSKVSPAAVALWSRVLREVADSRMIIKAWGLEAEASRARLRGLFAGHGVGADRLDLRGLNATAREHLESYHEVDVALDSYPYHGTTTTCEAMAMGVPVVTRVGAAHRSRVGLTLLSNAGLADLCAADDEAFVRTAAAIARDPARREAMRDEGDDGLRARLARSVLSDAAGYAERFEALMGVMVG